MGEQETVPAVDGNITPDVGEQETVPAVDDNITPDGYLPMMDTERYFVDGNGG